MIKKGTKPVYNNDSILDGLMVFPVAIVLAIPIIFILYFITPYMPETLHPAWVLILFAISIMFVAVMYNTYQR